MAIPQLRFRVPGTTSRVTLTSCGFAIVMCLLNLSSWTIVSPAPRTGVPGLLDMNPLAAFAYGTLAVALALRATTRPDTPRDRAGRALAWLVVLVALLRGARYLGWDVSFDQIAFHGAVIVGTPPSRMAPLAIVGVVFDGAAVLLLDAETKGGHRPAQLLVLGTALMALFAVTGYALGGQSLYGLGLYTSMTLDAAVALLALSLGILHARRGRGLTALLERPTLGATMARRLLPAIPVSALGLCLLRTVAQRAGMFDDAFGDALIMVTTVVVFGALVVRTGRSLDRLDEARRDAELDRERQYRDADDARAKVAAMLDAVAEAVIFATPDRRIVTANGRVAELFGVAPGEILGRRFEEILPHVERVFADPAAFAARVAGTARDPQGQFKAVFAQRWPQRRELEMFSTPVRVGGGEHAGRLYAFRDVTHEREVDRMKSELVALTSHELRTPLTSIHGFVHLLLEEEGLDPEDRRSFLEIIGKNTEQLVAIVNDLLDLSRIEAGKAELRSEALDIREIVTDVVEAMRPQIAAKRQRLALAFPDALPEVAGDSARVRQIVTNLVSNAHKYTPEGGSISLGAAHVESHGGAAVRLDVRDTGIGMTRDECAMLFTKFFRSQSRAARSAGGTGLGLAITRSLVEAHGGTIGVESAPGEGSTFSITLPVWRPTGQAPADDSGERDRALASVA